MRWLVVFLLLSWSTMAAGAGAGVPAGPELQSELKHLRRLALAKQPGQDQLLAADKALINRLAPRPEAVPFLMELLADPDLRVASLAAATLRDAPYVDEAYLPNVQAGLDRGLGWLSPVLASMPGEAAAREAVSRYLVSRGAPHNQEAYAVERLGVRALPMLLQAVRCVSPCGKKDAYLIAYAVSEMGAEALPILPGLREIIENPATPGDVAGGALQVLGGLGSHARTADAWLMALRLAKPELDGDIQQALVDIESDEAGWVLGARLDEHADPMILQVLASIGPAGRGAGPAVVRLLAHPDAEIRVAAARALGYIDYAPAVPPLMEKLDAVDDLRINWVAAGSLGRLGAVQARPALERTAATHRFPPVRVAAANALKHMGQPDKWPRLDDGLAGDMDFKAFEQLGEELPACRRPDVRRLKEPPNVKRRAGRDDRALEDLAFDSVVLSYGANAEEEESARREGRIIEVTADTMVEHRTVQREVPVVALRVAGGWLAGSNRGEWGGEVMFMPDRGNPYHVTDGNIVDIHRLGDRIVATMGLAHMFTNLGQVMELATDAQGRWQARPWRTLPGAPGDVELVAGPQLLFDANAGGTLLLSADGTFGIAGCLQ